MVIVFSLLLSVVSSYEAFVLNAPRPVGLLDNWNTNAAYLMFSATLLVARYLNARHERITILGLGVSVLLFSVALTKSRGAMLSALLAFLFLVYLTYRYHYSWRRTVGAMCWGTIGIVAESMLRGGLIYRVADSVISSNFTSGRLSLWRSTIDLYLTEPFTGIGFGALWLAMPGYRFSIDTTSIRSTHNDYLQVLAELGPVGFVLILVFVISILMLLPKVIREQSTQKHVSVDSAIWVAVIGVMVHSCFTYHLYQLSMLMLVGFFVGYLSRNYIWGGTIVLPQRGGCGSRSRLTVIGVSIFLFASILWFSTSLLGAILLDEAKASNDLTIMHKKAQYATIITPWNSAAYYQVALAIYQELISTQLNKNDK